MGNDIFDNEQDNQRLNNAHEYSKDGAWGAIKKDAGKAWDNTYGGLLDYLKGPQIGDAGNVSYDWSGYNKNAADQQALNQMLLARAQGRGGPSVAETQLQNTTQAVQRNAAAQAASARGGAMQQQAAARNAQSQSVQSQQEAAGQGAQVRAQEQQAATGQYMQALNAQQNAELQRQLQMGQQQLGQMGQETARFDQQRQAHSGGMGNIMGAVMGAASLFSDERAKTDIRSADHDVEDFLDALAAKRYRYREGYGQPGTQYGVIAQDVERTPMGRTMVERDPESGMRVVTMKPLSLLAAMADMHDRLRELEARKGGK